MELLSVSRARSIWLFDVNDLNPRGKSIQNELMEWLESSYHFSKVPKSPDDLDDTKGLAFSDGEFQVKEELFIRVALKIYNDGMVADTSSSTEDTDAFLKDVLESAAKEFTLTWKPDMLRRKLYLSDVFVKLDTSLGLLRPELEEFGKTITSLLGGKTQWGFSRIAFSAEIEGDNPLRFTLERQVARPFVENRYFSSAPFQTHVHLEMIREFEKLLS